MSYEKFSRLSSNRDHRRWPTRPGVREVRLRKRKQGQTKNHAAAAEIAKYVYGEAQAGKTMNAPKADAALQFEMDERTIGKIWSACKRGIAEIWGPIRRWTK